jgi:thiol-disulfide isomerase/thioredoxin
MRDSLIVFIVLFTFMCGCKKHKNIDSTRIAEGNVKIVGQIDSVNSRIVSISYFDLVRDDARYSMVIDSLTGEFEFNITIHHPQDIQFGYGRISFPLFVEQGDSIHLKLSTKSAGLDYNDIGDVVKVTGTQSAINTDIIRYWQFRANDYAWVEPNGLTFEQYVQIIEKHLLSEQQELNRFVEQHNPTQEFVTWANNHIVYQNANYLVDYEMYLADSGLPIIDTLFDIQPFPVSNPQGFISSAFMHHVLSYAGNKYFRSDTSIMSLAQAGHRGLAYIKSIERVRQEETSGVIKDFMLFKFFASLVGESVHKADSISQILLLEIKTPTFAKALDKTIENARFAKQGDIFYKSSALASTQRFDKNPVDYIRKLSLSQVVFVDIWATWCGPCLSEMPHLLAIETELNRLGVKVVTLCGRSPKDAWQQIVSDNKLPGEHFLLDGSQTKRLAKELNVKGYPTYMIFANGEIVEDLAPKPSDKHNLLDLLSKVKTENFDEQ